MKTNKPKTTYLYSQKVGGPSYILRLDDTCLFCCDTDIGVLHCVKVEYLLISRRDRNKKKVQTYHNWVCADCLKQKYPTAYLQAALKGAVE